MTTRQVYAQWKVERCISAMLEAVQKTGASLLELEAASKSVHAVAEAKLRESIGRAKAGK